MAYKMTPEQKRLAEGLTRTAKKYGIPIVEVSLAYPTETTKEVEKFLKRLARFERESRRNMHKIIVKAAYC
jgi:hypothetical protein